MTNLKSILIIVSLTIAFISKSQTVIVSNENLDVTGIISGGSTGTGQSFTIPSNYDITSISILSATASMTTLKIFDNNLATGTPIYIQSGINLTAAAQTEPLQTITLDTPVPVLANQEYSFVLEPSNGIAFLYPSDDYPDGQGIENNGTGYSMSSADFLFRISGTLSAAPIAPSTPAPIPSSSIISLLLMLGLITGLIIARRSIFNKN